MAKNKKAAAGFILFRIFDNTLLTLCLYDKDGRPDLPKGRCDNIDLNLFHTAQRECFEETSILVTKNNLISDDILSLDRLSLFCALTDQEVEIQQNPKTGKYEHIGYEWISPTQLKNLLPAYLKPAIPWALSIVKPYLMLRGEAI